MNKFISDMFTGKDNATWNLARVAWAISLGGYFLLAGYDIAVHGTAFDAQHFAIGLAAIMAAGGAAVGFQSKTEPGVE